MLEDGARRSEELGRLDDTCMSAWRCRPAPHVVATELGGPGATLAEAITVIEAVAAVDSGGVEPRGVLARRRHRRRLLSEDAVASVRHRRPTRPRRPNGADRRRPPGRRGPQGQRQLDVRQRHPPRRLVEAASASRTPRWRPAAGHRRSYRPTRSPSTRAPGRSPVSPAPAHPFRWTGVRARRLIVRLPQWPRHDEAVTSTACRSRPRSPSSTPAFPRRGPARAADRHRRRPDRDPRMGQRPGERPGQLRLRVDRAPPPAGGGPTRSDGGGRSGRGGGGDP